MYRKNKCGICLSIVLTGCMNSNSLKNGIQREVDDHGDRFVSVQEYKGEGFKLKNGEEHDKTAEDNRGEIEKAVKAFFLKQYKTDVEIYNIVGNVDGASVFVESVGTPHFYTYAVVPIDSKDTILTDQVHSLDGEVENAIASGVYGLMYEDEFSKLDDVIKEMAKNHGFIGETKEAIQNTATFGYGSPFYYVSFGDLNASNQMMNDYLENPKTSKEEWEKTINPAEIDPQSTYITIQLYKNKPGAYPTNEELEKIVKTMEETEGLPAGAYNILLHDHTIDKETGIGSKETTIERSLPDSIIKKQA
ncbi:DUF1672 family protein [Rossellomorea vietnamensis]|uniref:DUF1672 family protein n=1 Tax=Rossellomorea vietnamensis TaxID=218284 RepID=UPI001E5BEFD6|nr:DUF1672 family protein [Rossellomorea vietnamensis]MCC5804335.1 DUF1672 family protein [Rossellomorea vietnamensis]